MPRLDTRYMYTKRAYYFGLIALISFLVARGLVSVQKLTETSLPASLIIVIIIVSVFCSLACIYSAYKGRKESGTFKKVIAMLLAFGSIVYIILLIIEALKNML